MLPPTGKTFQNVKKIQTKFSMYVQGRPWEGAGCVAAPGPRDQVGPIFQLVEAAEELTVGVIKAGL
jgi:hypothetical protein